jgi:hypothetical protein
MANWAWPEIIDEDSARDAAHKAGGWAAAVAGITALLAVISLTGSSLFGITPLSLVDAALFGVVAWRVWYGSRAWAVAGLSLYSLEVLFSVINHPPGVGILTIIVLLALINGVRGTFALHKYMEMNQQQAMSAAQAAGAQNYQPYMPTTAVPPPPPLPPPDPPK